MVKCIECGAVLCEDEVERETVCWEDYYGVSTMFQNRNYGNVAVCPHCHGAVEEYYEKEEEK